MKIETTKRRMPRPPEGRGAVRSKLPIDKGLFQFGDLFCRVKPFGACLRAVHDRVATLEAERVLEIVETLAGRFITRVLDPTVGLQERGRPEIAVGIPPVAWA